MLLKEKKDIKLFYCENRKILKKENSLLSNLKKIQFSNKKDKNLSLNIDKFLYAK